MSLSSRPILPKMGFNFKILLVMSMSLIGFAVTSGLVFNMIQRNELKSFLLQQGEMMVTMLSDSLQQALYFEDKAAIDKAVKTIISFKVHENLKAVTVYDSNGAILTRQLPNKTDSHLKLPSIVDPMATALSSFHNNPEQGKIWENNELIIFTVPVSVMSTPESKESLFFTTEKTDPTYNVIGYAQLVIVKFQFTKEVNKTVLQTAVLTIIFLLISWIAAYFLTRDTLEPLKRLIKTIRAQSGRQTEVIPDEIELLGDTFSQLVEELERSFSTIQSLKDGLEETVTERTQELSQALADLKSTHLQLVHSEKMVAIGRLVAGVAHEINNTTNFISGSLPLLRIKLSELEGLLSGPEGKQPDVERCAAIFKTLTMLMGNINEGTRRTTKIVGNLSSFARPVDDLPRPVDINKCLRTTTSLAYPEYKHRIELKMDLAAELPLVEGVQDQFNQVFMNLLLNALQATPLQGTITISTSLMVDHIRIVFHDTGFGIPAEVINHIFEPFFTTKEIGKGTGLGLSISYGIIRKHQGTIVVQSTPGQGTEFEITLPLKLKQEQSLTTGDKS